MRGPTFGAPTAVQGFFGLWGVSVPIGGLGNCNVAGGFDDLTSPIGPLSHDRSLVSSWPAIPTDFFAGSATATTDYGSMSAQAHAEFNGEYTNLNVTGSNGFGIADEGFTITSPSSRTDSPGMWSSSSP